MRTVLNFNENWLFTKNSAIPTAAPTDAVAVNLPHSWNAEDGQDGGNDYYRGTCNYVKAFAKSILPENSAYYLEILGANSSADVILNGKKLAHHDGGYSTWRVNITDALEEENLLVISVDNAPNNTVYPQTADFTFYGGLYRNVNIIAVPESRFDLDYLGGPAIAVTPEMSGNSANVKIDVYLTNANESQTLVYKIFNKDSELILEQSTNANETTTHLEIENVHLWHGLKDPYLYTAEVTLLSGSEVLDSVKTRFGCRTFEIDSERGFILNGEEYPLHGVSRHQDRLGIGNALLPEHHKEDADFIKELGATTIRLAHYQHDQYFYDLCDEYGFVVWAEIPYISQHMATGRENTISQMKELIVQNYNHPSIVVWGLSNEITMNGAKDPDLLENHRILNDLVHSMDKTRKTVIACVSMCDMDEEYVHIPDAVSYNHYFGWYGGDTSMNGPWFDKFHEKYPNTPIGVSEYGCEALNWHTSNPTQGDYTEEYQSYYHEELIKQLFTRKYIWATHVWNMFDFGADARCEGGENGQNHKGLMTFDRKYKKDSFYAYKAWLSSDPFVHICSKRYVDRVEDVTKVTVYSNLPEVELFVNGKSVGKKQSPEHFFYFDVENVGESVITAVAGEFKDESHIRKVEEFNEEYRLREKNAVLNWFDITEVAGHLSLNDKISDILATEDGRQLFYSVFEKSVPKNDTGMVFDTSMMEMLGNFTFLRLAGMMGTLGINLTKEQLLEMNTALNKIKKI